MINHILRVPNNPKTEKTTKRMKQFTRFSLLLLLCCAFISIYSSCSEENNCSMGGRQLVYSTFYTPETADRVIKKDTLDSLTVTALGTDSILINNMKTVSTISLPLRFTEEQTAWVFHYDYKRRPRYADTVYIEHQNKLYFQSMECGYTMTQTIRSIRVRNGAVAGAIKMDSIKILNTNANINETQNLQVFFRATN